MGCDRRYVTRANLAFASVNDFGWETSLSLRICYRIPLNTIRFLNEAIIHADGFPRLISSTKSVEQKDDRILNAPPTYYKGNPYENARHAFTMLNMMIRLGHWRPDDVYVLAPSVDRISSMADDDAEPSKKEFKKGRSPVMAFADLLTNAGLPIFVRNGKGRETDAVERGKIVFSSFPAVKGCQRKVVFVFDFSNRYFAFADTTGDPLQLPLPIWVACTRTSQKLFLFAEAEVDVEAHFKFLSLGKMAELEACGALIIHQAPDYKNVKPMKNRTSASRNFTVTDMTSKIYNGRGLHAILSHLKSSGQLTRVPRESLPVISLGDGTITLPSPSGGWLGDGLVESVSDINGAVITLLLEIVGAHKRPRGNDPFIVANIREFVGMDNVPMADGDGSGGVDARGGAQPSSAASVVAGPPSAIVEEDPATGDFTVLHRSELRHLARGRELVERYAAMTLPCSPSEISPDLVSVCLELATYFRTTPAYPGNPMRHYYTQLEHSGFSWLAVDDVRRVVQRLVDNFPFATDPSSIFEYNLGKQSFVVPANRAAGFADGVQIKLEGLADLCSSGHLVEIKTKKEIETVDFLQLCCYKFLDEAQTRNSGDAFLTRAPRRYIIYNVLAHEQWELTTPFAELKGIIHSLAALRIAGVDPAPDDQTFIEKCRAIAANPSYYADLSALAAPLISAPTSPMVVDAARLALPATPTRAGAVAAALAAGVGGGADRESATQEEEEAPFSPQSPSPKRSCTKLTP
jgi:hypothetical protein